MGNRSASRLRKLNLIKSVRNDQPRAEKLGETTGNQITPSQNGRRLLPQWSARKAPALSPRECTRTPPSDRMGLSSDCRPPISNSVRRKWTGRSTCPCSSAVRPGQPKLTLFGSMSFGSVAELIEEPVHASAERPT
jgi:hypothetical protein